MLKRVWIYALSSILGVGFLFTASSAWAADFAVTCTPSGPAGALPGCIPAGVGFPNSWFISAGAENAVAAEQTMTLLFAGGKFGVNDTLGSPYGVFNVIDEGIGVNKISDQIQLVNGGLAGDKLIFSSDVSALVPGGVFLAKETGTGIIVDLPLGLTDGNFAKLGFDTEFAFNPLGFPGINDTSDFVSVVPEPSTIGLLGPSLVGLMMVMYRSKKRGALAS